jgi:ankyrin repeat protein
MIFTAAIRFRWAFCQLEALRHCLAPRVRNMLKELPETLDETYERILREINKANRDHAHRLLQCLTVAVRPLRVAELAEVLAVDFGTASRGETSKLNTDWRWEDQQEAVLSTCSSLISIVYEEGSQIIQFSHFSVKEFLTSSRITGSSADVSAFHILLEPAHTVLAEACLAVLLRLGELVNEDNVEDKFPLAQYAAEHWVDHARFENVSFLIREGMERLFDPDKPYFATWLHVHDIDTWPIPDPLLHHFAPPNRKMATPLYYAALFGFHDLTEQLIIKDPQQVNATGGYYVSPLAAALNRGHIKVAQLLYERGADVDVQGSCRRTPLDGASCSGQLEIVQWLLSRGANPNVQDDSEPSYTPLHSAVHFGHAEVSRLLLQYRADINARNSKGQSPLHYALEKGRVNVARLLLEHGANIYAEDNNGRTALQVALKRGYHDIANFLSDHGSK